jgi:hypothetical protein
VFLSPYEKIELVSDSLLGFGHIFASVRISWNNDQAVYTSPEEDGFLFLNRLILYEEV